MIPALSLAAPLAQPEPAARYYLWEGKDRQSGPYTHEEMLALFEGGPPRSATRPVRFVVHVPNEQIEILECLRERSLTACQLIEATDMGDSAVRARLHRLCQMRLVTVQFRTPWRWFLTPRGRQALEQLSVGAP